MPNPGSPQAMQKARAAAPSPMMSKNTMIGMFAVLIIMMVVMTFRVEIGHALNFALNPLFGFGGTNPVLTLVVAGLFMITLSTIIRSLMTDFVTQAKNQKISSEFNKEMRKARLENNLFKLKKLQEEQPKMMAKQMEASTSMMKVMPITMLVVIPIYAWIFYFVSFVAMGTDAITGLPIQESWTETVIIGGVEEHIFHNKELLVSMPWFIGRTVNILDTIWILPMWIIIYTMISLPIGQLENRIVRYFLLTKRLKELDRTQYKS